MLDGYNGTVMAYGQTGTGKTYTLGQLGKDDVTKRGIMARALEDIIVNTSPETDSVEISYLQVFKLDYLSIFFTINQPVTMNMVNENITCTVSKFHIAQLFIYLFCKLYNGLTENLIVQSVVHGIHTRFACS